MQALLALSRLIDSITTFAGKAVGWLVLVAVLVSAGNATIRYIFSNSSNAWLELQWYLFAAVFLVCAAYTLLKNEHIRIDIVSSRLTPMSRNVIELIGLLGFILPLCAIMLYEAWPYFMLSWRGNEMSSNAGGLIRWPSKALIIVGFGLLLAQTLSETIKRVAVMMALIPDPHVKKASAH